jgi:hypothetical protein
VRSSLQRVRAGSSLCRRDKLCVVERRQRVQRLFLLMLFTSICKAALFREWFLLFQGKKNTDGFPARGLSHVGVLSV